MKKKIVLIAASVVAVATMTVSILCTTVWKKSNNTSTESVIEASTEASTESKVASTTATTEKAASSTAATTTEQLVSVDGGVIKGSSEKTEDASTEKSSEEKGNGSGNSGSGSTSSDNSGSGSSSSGGYGDSGNSGSGSSSTEAPTSAPTEAATEDPTSAPTEATTEASTSTPTSTKCNHSWKEVWVDEKGHYEKVCVQEAYDENVYYDHAFCNYCGLDCTAAGVDAGEHSAYCGLLDVDGRPSGSSTSLKPVVIDTIHHDAVYEKQWIVDEEAWCYYQCSKCGALRE